MPIQISWSDHVITHILPPPGIFRSIVGEAPRHSALPTNIQVSNFQDTVVTKVDLKKCRFQIQLPRSTHSMGLGDIKQTHIYWQICLVKSE